MRRQERAAPSILDLMLAASLPHSSLVHLPTFLYLSAHSLSPPYRREPAGRPIVSGA